METFAFELLTVGESVATLDSSIYSPDDQPQCRGALFEVNSGSISYRVDSGTPTTDSGHIFIATEEMRSLKTINEVINFKAVRVGDSDAKVAISYVR